MIFFYLVRYRFVWIEKFRMDLFSLFQLGNDFLTIGNFKSFIFSLRPHLASQLTDSFTGLDTSTNGRQQTYGYSPESKRDVSSLDPSFSMDYTPEKCGNQSEISYECATATSYSLRKRRSVPYKAEELNIVIAKNDVFKPIFSTLLHDQVSKQLRDKRSSEIVRETTVALANEIQLLANQNKNYLLKTCYGEQWRISLVKVN